MEILSLPDQGHLKLTAPVPLTQHPVGVYLASLSPGSVVTMRQSLNTMASLLTRGGCDAITLDWSKLRYQHTAALKVALRQKYSPSTVNKMLCALRRVLKEAVRLDLIDPIDYSHAVDLSNMRVQGKPRGRALTRTEITQLLEVCQSDSPIDVRDTAIIAILRGTGLRRAEVVNLDLEDFDPTTGKVLVRLGKGGKDRMAYLPRSAYALVENWLRVRGEMPGPLLCPVNKGGNLQMRRMSPDAVLKILKKRALQAGVEEFSPHDFRRTFCSDLLDASVDIVTVQKLAGHASPVTTAKYDRRGEETKRRAVQKLEL
ncbi:MAG: tyrosine-type recombinase/integrase [Okeania sp. SIO1H6]|nr:tyrosine-type recombinase/integrase [Okeania sp. SIO1H6]